MEGKFFVTHSVSFKNLLTFYQWSANTDVLLQMVRFCDNCTIYHPAAFVYH